MEKIVDEDGVAATPEIFGKQEILRNSHLKKKNMYNSPMARQVLNREAGIGGIITGILLIASLPW